MKCPFCQTDMKLLTKWSGRVCNLYDQTAQSTTGIGLVSFRKRGALIKRVSSEIVYPGTFLCSTCGFIANKLATEDIKLVLRAEQDDSYEMFGGL